MSISRGFCFTSSPNESRSSNVPDQNVNRDTDGRMFVSAPFLLCNQSQQETKQLIVPNTFFLNEFLCSPKIIFLIIRTEY